MPLNPFYDLLPKASDPSDSTQYRWGTVQPDGLILLDTDTSPLVDQPPTLTVYVPGDRVFVLIDNRRATVLGRAYVVTPPDNPGPQPDPAATERGIPQPGPAVYDDTPLPEAPL